jgi:hypothetical protein
MSFDILNFEGFLPATALLKIWTDSSGSMQVDVPVFAGLHVLKYYGPYAGFGDIALTYNPSPVPIPNVGAGLAGVLTLLAMLGWWRRARR